VTFDTQYTITNGDATIVFPSGTEMTKTGGGSLDLTTLTIQDITDSLKNTSQADIAGALTIGIPDLRLSFSKDITVTIPVDSSYEGKTLTIWYQEAGESIWTQGPTCSVSSGRCTFQTNHATTYSAGDQPSGVAAAIDTPEQAKISDWSAYLFQDDSKCATKLKLNLEGKHFSKNAEVKIGSKSASSVERKSSRELSATFCLEKLLNVKTNLSRKVTVTNPDTDPSKAKDTINVKTVFPRFTEKDFDPSTSEGIKNIQQALVKLKFLTLPDITGTYTQVTVSAVTAFQSKNNLPATGFAGPLTKTKLAKLYGKET